MTWKARIEWVQGQGDGFVYGGSILSGVISAESLTGDESAAVRSSEAPDFNGQHRGLARITPLEGSFLVSIGDTEPDDASSIRMSVGQAPALVSIAENNVLSFIQSADAPTPHVSDQARSGYLVVPDDAEDLPIIAKALYIETAGTLKCLPVDNADGAFLTVPVEAGVFSMWLVRRVHTDSACGAIWAGHD